MRRTSTLLLLVMALPLFSQTLDPDRRVDWTLAGLRDTITNGFIAIDMQSHGAIGDGTTPNDAILAEIIAANIKTGLILHFPAGNFLFKETIHIPGNVIIRGEGPGQTTLTMDLGGSGHSLNIQGSLIKADTSSLIASAAKDSNQILVADPGGFLNGDWIQLSQLDSDLVTSSWAEHSVGQIVRIKTIEDNIITLESPLRMGYNTSRAPFIQKIIPVENVGIECLKIIRLDNTAPEQSSNINFTFVVNCWVSGIESVNCTFSHIQANRSSNLLVSKSYFHHGFEYGGGGRGYGVMLQSTSNECRIENNLFEHLRHSMILQSGANGNVFAYNYSFDPFWDSVPNDAAGDMVVHGNYTYANLFEQNICQNIVIDNSHGPNGPFNTFFRNRAEGFGIFFSAANSPDQNILGNELPNTAFPYSLVNYTIQGANHLLHGNNNKGVIHPPGTTTLDDISYAYTERPVFVPVEQWAGIGTPNSMGAASIPAYDRYAAGVIFSDACNNPPVSVNNPFDPGGNLFLYPNPVQSELTIESTLPIQHVSITTATGQGVYTRENPGTSDRIHTEHWKNGIYFLVIQYANHHSAVKMVVKTNTF
ncbi:MAG: T9SS type A sorting domain-containing protein [Saprospiraceae bacterium]|nr:T9SS type A sorting domain-containing protein [Saprospiraceae bacterium]